ncbi:MAG: YceI family protein [Cyclobacteriaceae bacterium]
MKKLFLLALVIAQGAFGQNKPFNIDEFYPIERSHSYMNFSAKYMGYAQVKGNFADFNGTFRYDPNDISRTSVSFAVEVASIDSNLEWRDNDLKSDRWFDAEKFPVISFISKSAKQTNEGFDITGDLTIKDVTKEVTIEMNPASGVLKDIRDDAQVILSGSYTLDRTDYGVKWDRWSRVKEGIVGVANEVTVEFSMLGKQVKMGNFSNRFNREDRPPGRLYAAYKLGGTKELFTELDKVKSEIELNTFVLNTVGYFLLKSGEVKDAIKVFEKNRDEFTDDAGVYDSLGEAYAAAGDFKKAIVNYKTALEKNPSNYNAKEMLRNLE